ncbi:MAG: Xylose isomerase protein barrel [Segetibacter sp.]|nr:Xylose isomerase protein barrel [Segetibacter sp.]
MNTTRRAFLRNSSLITAGAMAFGNEAFAAKKTKQIVGIQLYSVRDDMKKDPLATLKQLREMGYTHVEHANYVNRKLYGWSPSEFRKVLDDLGLKMPSGHTVMGPQHWDSQKKEFSDSWKQTVEDAAILGQSYVISPWLDASLRKTYDDTLRYMEVFNKSGELCKKSGMKFGYHNHDFEFSEKMNGMMLYDIILQNTDPALVIHQLDMGNLYNGGAKTEDVLRKHPGRFESLHVKDEIKSAGGGEKYESTILGQGIINLKSNLDFVKKAGGSKYLIIEQESYQGRKPLDDCRQDLVIMRKWGYK